MPLSVEVAIHSKRGAEANLVAALKAMEPHCPRSEHWFVTVVEDTTHSEPIVTVFRTPESGSREVDPVLGWRFVEEDRPGNRRIPVYRKLIPYGPGGSLRVGPAQHSRPGRRVPAYSKPVPFGSDDESWVVAVAGEVGALLQALQP
jgi:hypothetical protein